jgi:D-tyrosyl-tRNA(Tyr) deacylase
VGSVQGKQIGSSLAGLPFFPRLTWLARVRRVRCLCVSRTPRRDVERSLAVVDRFKSVEKEKPSEFQDGIKALINLRSTFQRDRFIKGRASPRALIKDLAAHCTGHRCRTRMTTPRPPNLARLGWALSWILSSLAGCLKYL